MRTEQERPHCGKELDALVGMRFLLAAQTVDNRVKHNRVSQRLDQRVMTKNEIRKGDQGDPRSFSDGREDDQRMQSILELRGHGKEEGDDEEEEEGETKGESQKGFVRGRMQPVTSSPSP